MKKELEKTYGSALRGIMFAVNPLKKKLLKTYCTIHRFINMQAIELLKIEGYQEEYEFYHKNIKKLNEGVTWADQDFKSSNHFYHFSKAKGLFGFSDALTESKKYRLKSLDFIKAGDADKAIFYFGASCHLIQDCTVPQHVNNKLLKSHRRFELWIISKFLTDYSFSAESGIIQYDEFDSYIINNSFMANNTFLKYNHIVSREERYYKIATAILKEAQRTTAGVMVDYYKEIKEKILSL